ncbi:outer membrane porin, OprD family [Acinetobacter cumulans]|uniref:Outer membrane porin, OprD family n=2 Tax=Acinetobacter cumulans TaxID=2136182 RepID=A0A498CWY0_9GAMM|nr:outer membrane porin, OprD family [Acinetobacter cumulans]
MCGMTAVSGQVQADFIDDSSVTLTARNFYLDRNFTDPDVRQSAARQWSQGFILNAKSGYTEGAVGFGLDLYAGAGFNLWGKSGYQGTSLMPVDSKGDPADSFGEAGVTAKAKISKTEIKAGLLQPLTPVLVGSPARLLPQQYRGVAVESKDVDNIKIEAGYVNRVNHRNSTDWEKIRLSGANMKYKSVETDGLYYVGGYYYLRPETTFALYTANLVDVYDQYTFWVRNTHHFNERVNLFTDFRYFRTVESGAELAGEVDSHHGNIVLALGVDNHKFTTGYIHNSGDTGFPYLSGGEANTYIDAWATDFLNPNEKAWSVRYDYDFKNQVPGLKLMTRYTKGTDIKLENLKPGETLEERKFGIELSYQLQSTKLKGLFIRLRHEDYKNDFGPKATFQPAKEQRVNIDYTWKF